MGGGCGLELFEFVSPATVDGGAASYWRAGFSHLCLVAEDIESVAERIEKAGGNAAAGATVVEASAMNGLAIDR